MDEKTNESLSKLKIITERINSRMDTHHHDVAKDLLEYNELVKNHKIELHDEENKATLVAAITVLRGAKFIVNFSHDQLEEYTKFKSSLNDQIIAPFTKNKEEETKSDG